MKGRIPLNALRAFDTVARLNSLTAAAEELSVTPSAISRQLSNLEEEIGTVLLKREGRRLQLTAAGRRLQSGLLDAFIQIANAVDRLRQTSNGNTLRLSVAPIFASTWLVPRLERFSSLSPDVEVAVVDQSEQTGGPDQAKGSPHYDIVIGWGRYEDDATVVAEKLTGGEEVFPVCHPNLCRSGSLAGATFLHLEHVGNPWSWPSWPTFLEAVGLDSTGASEGLHLTVGLVLDAARKSKGVILLCTTLAHDDIEAELLVRPIAESMPVEDAYWLLTARTERHRPEVVAFRNWLVEELAACFGPLRDR